MECASNLDISKSPMYKYLRYQDVGIGANGKQK